MATSSKDILKNTALWAALRKKIEENNEDLWGEVWDEVGETAFRQGERSAFAALRLKWKQDPTRAQRYFDEHGGEFIKEVSDTDVSTIRQIIADNWGIGERSVGKLIDDQLGSEDRGKFIYRTEIHTAHESSTKEASIELGAQWSVWVAVMDQRTRETHWDVNGEIQPADELFSNGTEPAEEINCRCRRLFFTTLQEARDFVANLSTPVSADTLAWNIRVINR